MRDSFDKVETPVIGRVKDLRIILNVCEREIPSEEGGAPTIGNSYEANYEFYVPTDGDPHFDRRNGDLFPKLTATQKTKLDAFLDDMLKKAQGAGAES